MKGLIPVVAFALLLAHSCSYRADPVQPFSPFDLDESVDGKLLTFDTGQSFTLTLECWGDAGYMWECQIGDTVIISQKGDPKYTTSYPGKVGGVWIVTFTFLVKQSGQTAIRLDERRLWLNEPPLSTVNFIVYVP